MGFQQWRRKGPPSEWEIEQKGPRQFREQDFFEKTPANCLPPPYVYVDFSLSFFLSLSFSLFHCLPSLYLIFLPLLPVFSFFLPAPPPQKDQWIRLNNSLVEEEDCSGPPPRRPAGRAAPPAAQPTSPGKARPAASRADRLLSLAETRPGEHPARRQALARHRAPEPGRGGEQAGGGAQGDALGGRAAAAGPGAPAGAQGPAAEGRGLLPRPAGQGGERVSLSASIPVTGVHTPGFAIHSFQTL